jgi:hypothetical protein
MFGPYDVTISTAFGYFKCLGFCILDLLCFETPRSERYHEGVVRAFLALISYVFKHLQLHYRHGF